MPTSQLRDRIAALRADAATVGQELAAEASQLSADELFELTGDLQGALNATDGAQLVATAHAATHETRLTDRGPVEVHHDLGFIDPMAPSEVSLATGTGQWAAGRRVGLAAALGERFPRLLGSLLQGQVCSSTAQKVVSVCDGLDAQACAAVEAVLIDRLPDLDPARVKTVTRRIAARVAAGQVRAAQRRHRRDRYVEVSPGPDGTTMLCAQVPAAAAAAIWSAVTTLAEDYENDDPCLTADQARADAFVDLLLTNVEIQAKVTIGIPVITTPEPAGDPDAATRPHTHTAPETSAGAGADAGPKPESAAGADPDPTPDATAGPDATAAPESTAGAEAAPEPDATAGPDVTAGPAGPGRAAHGGTAFGSPSTRDDDHHDPDQRPVAVGGLGIGNAFSVAAALSGCEIRGIGYIDADSINALLTAVPLDVGRALLDARTGTLLETTNTAYRPPRAMTDFVTTRDGTCRMWGCDRPAVHCDVDHARPWPAGATTPANLGGLCRRHHRLKQRRRWIYRIAPNGTVTWTSPSGKKRTTLPDHAPWPPPQPEPAAPPAAPITSRAAQLVDAGPPPF